MILIEEMPKKSIKLFEVNEKGTIDIVNDVYYQEAFYSIKEKLEAGSGKAKYYDEMQEILKEIFNYCNCK